MIEEMQSVGQVEGQDNSGVAVNHGGWHDDSRKTQVVIGFEASAVSDGRKLVDFEFTAPDDSAEALRRMGKEGGRLQVKITFTGLIKDDDAGEEGR